MRIQRLVFLAVPIGLGLIAFFVPRRGAEREIDAASQPAPAEEPRGGDSPLAALRSLADPSPAGAPASELPAQRAALDAPAAAPAAVAAGAALVGQVEVRGVGEQVFSQESGSLDLWLMTSTRRWRESVRVELGRFEIEPPEQGFGPFQELIVSLAQGELGGRPVVPPSFGLFGFGAGQNFAPNASGELRLSLCFVEEVLLEVVHAEDGRPVQDVRLVRAVEGHFAAFASHPGPDLAGERRLGPSPVRLPAAGSGLTEQESWFVGTPGAAWRPMRIDRARGGRQRVELAAGADLEIRIEGQADVPGLYLLLHAGSAEGLRAQPGVIQLPVPSPGSPLRLGGLPVGLLRASLQAGDWFDPQRLVARQDLELVAGQLGVLRFDLSELLGQPEPWVRGRLALSAGEAPATPSLLALPWVQGESQFFVYGEDPVGSARVATLSADGPASFRFEIQLAASGPHLLAVPGRGFARWVDVPAEGLEGLLLELPQALEIEVVCLEADGERPFAPKTLSAAAVGTGEHGDSHVALALEAEGDGRFRLRCPPGQVRFNAIEPLHRLIESRFEVGPGSRRIELRFQAACGVRLVPRLPGGEAGPAWSFGDLSKFGLEPLDGQESVNGLMLSQGTVTLTHGQAGRFRVRLPDLPAFEVPRNLEVELLPGQVVDLVVELVPRG